jgi:hypothetical protein
VEELFWERLWTCRLALLMMMILIARHYIKEVKNGGMFGTGWEKSNFVQGFGCETRRKETT